MLRPVGEPRRIDRAIRRLQGALKGVPARGVRLTWRGGELRKTAELPNIANHIAGTRAIDMADAADFDGDGVSDIAAPSFDRSRLRIVSFTPKGRDIADVPLAEKALTNLALIAEASGPPAIAVGLADGSLAVIRRVP